MTFGRTVCCASFLLAGCGTLFEPPELAKCEEIVTSVIPNPESYERVEYTSFDLGEFWHVELGYTFVNEAGVRTPYEVQTCDFAIVNGKPDTSRFLKLDPSYRIIDAH